MADVQQSVRYSITVPFYNERESIMPLYGRLKEIMDTLPDVCECVFVDDGSTDQSLELLQQVRRTRPSLPVALAIFIACSAASIASLNRPVSA